VSDREVQDRRTIGLRGKGRPGRGLKEQDLKVTDRPIKGKGREATDHPIRGKGQAATDRPIKDKGQAAIGRPIKGKGQAATDHPIRGKGQAATDHPIKGKGRAAEDHRATDLRDKGHRGKAVSKEKTGRIKTAETGVNSLPAAGKGQVGKAQEGLRLAVPLQARLKNRPIKDLISPKI